MPITHAIWTVDPDPQPLPLTRLPSEAFLEDMIIQRPEILSGEWMLIGSQEHTGFGDRIDLLAIAPDASLVLIELKRDPTPREVVAQARSEEHTSDLQSLMRISYAVFCLKKKTQHQRR